MHPPWLRSPPFLLVSPRDSREREQVCPLHGSSFMCRHSPDLSMRSTCLISYSEKKKISSEYSVPSCSSELNFYIPGLCMGRRSEEDDLSNSLIPEGVLHCGLLQADSNHLCNNSVSSNIPRSSGAGVCVCVCEHYVYVYFLFFFALMLKQIEFSVCRSGRPTLWVSLYCCFCFNQ